jgi:hypothetical protein
MMNQFIYNKRAEMDELLKIILWAIFLIVAGFVVYSLVNNLLG